MKSKPLNKAEEENYKSYHIPGCPAYQRRTKSSVYFNAGSTVKHEMAKALGALMLQKWGDVKFNESTLKALNALADAVNVSFKDHPKTKKNFLTEVVPNKEPDRRVDLVSLEDDYRYEFETKAGVIKDFKREKTITIKL